VSNSKFAVRAGPVFAGAVNVTVVGPVPLLGENEPQSRILVVIQLQVPPFGVTVIVTAPPAAGIIPDGADRVNVHVANGPLGSLRGLESVGGSPMEIMRMT
jgi:hypothetical protein